jgi:hypothetical protein
MAPVAASTAARALRWVRAPDRGSSRKLERVTLSADHALVLRSLSVESFVAARDESLLRRSILAIGTGASLFLVVCSMFSRMMTFDPWTLLVGYRMVELRHSLSGVVLLMVLGSLSIAWHRVRASARDLVLGLLSFGIPWLGVAILMNEAWFDYAFRGYAAPFALVAAFVFAVVVAFAPDRRQPLARDLRSALRRAGAAMALLSTGVVAHHLEGPGWPLAAFDHDDAWILIKIALVWIAPGMFLAMAVLRANLPCWRARLFQAGVTLLLLLVVAAAATAG